ncbi:MAG: iron ABC transporter permease [Flavobacteriales bacterium]|nr:iron ABC transporter permease [Flavobacteriales bacterium]
MHKLFSTLKFARKGWLITLLIILSFILLPLFSILFRAFEPDAPTWDLITTYFLSKYIWNSMILVFGVVLFCLILGVIPAWLIANYDFPGRKLFKLGLLLPLAIPTYIMAYTYTGVFDSTGTIQQITRSWFGQETANAVYFDFMTPFWLVILLACCLYPYVYSACLISFSSNSARQLEASASLGANGRSRFFKIGLPLAKPALFAGLFLVVMEVLNEYGAVQYFNYKTFTTGIFTAWENGDLTSAVRVAIMLFGIAMLFLFSTKIFGGKQRMTSSSSQPIKRIKLTGNQRLIAFMCCGTIFLFAFLIPFAQLIYWAIQSFQTVVDTDFYRLTWNTFIVSLFAAAIITAVGFILLYAGNQLKAIGGKRLSSLGVLGYSVPGAIIAIGIIIPFVYFDHALATNWFLGTVFGLIIAYLIRFLAVSYGPLKGAFEKQGSRLDEAGQNLKSSPLKTMLKIHFPILKPAFAIAIILVFVDIMKELPITLILRPMNYDTLATEAYRYAQVNESAMQSSPASVLLILLGIIPILLLSKMLKR